GEPAWRRSSCRKRHTMEGLLPTSIKVAFTPSKPRPAALAPADCGFSPPDGTESLTNWSLEGVPRDGFATGPVPSNYAHGARAVPSGAHLAALPNKMALAQAAYWIRKRPVAVDD